ncbi:O-antigen ligase [Bradyrhizobium sp. WSM2793]|uniref:O-antigen ligase family protein n=1 Tax=Bradyrhizobium sp. WSM2793 TaxID=1038866 RepID=UPI000366A448|nr:hypothetical protein [Bradyrhizobium sp. WSM2793]
MKSLLSHSTLASCEQLPPEPRNVGAFACYVVLLAILFPGGLVAVDVSGAKLTVGRIAILILLIPALVRLTRADRHLIASDYLAAITGIWMIGAAAYVGGDGSLSSASAVCLEYVGGYFVARGLLFGAAVSTFIQVLKTFVIIVVFLALADSVTGRLVVHTTLAGIFQSAPLLQADFRADLLRTASTFDHPILFGTFCTLSGAMLMSYEQTFAKRTWWVGVCLLGCILSMSSAPLLSFIIAIVAFAYECLMKNYSSRWSVFWLAVAGGMLAIFIIANHPIGWIITHLTLDPVSGYFRLMIWDLALLKIGQEPWTGFAFNPLNNEILDYTVDCVWLQLAIRFGIPMIVLVALTNIAAILPARRNASKVANDPPHWGFTTALVLTMLTGLTVHYWHFLWIFWALCLGLRASLREASMTEYRMPADEPMPLMAADISLVHARR